MGLTHIRARIANPAKPSRSARLTLLVDSGAIYSVVPSTLLRKLGLEERLSRGRDRNQRQCRQRKAPEKQRNHIPGAGRLVLKISATSFHCPSGILRHTVTNFPRSWMGAPPAGWSCSV